jgi:hypothetical protein
MRQSLDALGTLDIDCDYCCVYQKLNQLFRYHFSLDLYLMLFHLSRVKEHLVLRTTLNYFAN